MQQPQPHLEILSRNRVNRSTIIVAVIPVTLFSGVLIYALWRFLLIIAITSLVLLLVSALYLVAILAIDVRRRWIAAHVIHLGEYGIVDAMGWRMLPLALPAPVINITEEPNKDDEAIKRATVLTCYDAGYSLRDIEKHTGVKLWKVQKWTSEYAAQKVKQTG